MRRLMTGHAVTFNRRHRRAGHLFQNRFKNILVEEEPYLLELVRYIHLNPVRSRLPVTVENLDRYPWTGHAVLLGHRAFAAQDTDLVLERFGGKVGQARRAYVQFVREGATRTRVPDLDGGGLCRSAGGWELVPTLRRGRERWAYDERVLGSSEFVQEIVGAADNQVVPRQFDTHAVVRQLTIKAAELYAVREELVRSPSKRQPAVQARAAIAGVAVGRLGIPALRVARELGVSLQSVLRGLDAASAAQSALDSILPAILDDRRRAGH